MLHKRFYDLVIKLKNKIADLSILIEGPLLFTNIDFHSDVLKL